MLGEKIRKIRRDMGITQENLGEEVGLTPATISRIEGGSRGLSIERLEAIAKALDVSMAELFLDEAERVEFHPVKKPHQPNPFEVAPKWAQELLDEVRSLREQDKKQEQIVNLLLDLLRCCDFKPDLLNSNNAKPSNSGSRKSKNLR